MDRLMVLDDKSNTFLQDRHAELYHAIASGYGKKDLVQTKLNQLLEIERELTIREFEE